jgi:hypothetical protein
MVGRQRGPKLPLPTQADPLAGGPPTLASAPQVARSQQRKRAAAARRAAKGAAAGNAKAAAAAGEEPEADPPECSDPALAFPNEAAAAAAEPETAPCYASPWAYFLGTFLLRGTRCDSTREPLRARTADGQRR